MKQCFIYIVLLSNLLVACISETSNNLLAQADSLMQSRPDSALLILQNIAKHQLITKADHAYYALLLIQAKYKNYIKLTSDTLIQNTVTYYELTQNIPMLAKANYILGCTFSDMGEYDKAIKAYHNAILSATKAKNNKLLGLIHNGIAHLYQKQGFDNKADSIYQFTEKLAVQIKDSVLLSETLIRRGIYTMSLNEKFYRDAEKQILQAYNISKKINSLNVLSTATATLSNLYSRMGNPTQALHFAKELSYLQKTDSTELSRSYLLLGDAYYKIGENDSANIYLKKSLITTNNYTIKEGACMRLADIAQLQKNYEQALKWEEKRNAYHEKWHQSQQQIEITIAEKEIEQKEERQQQHVKLHTYNTIFFIGILSIIATFTYILIRRKNKKESIILSLQQERNTNEFNQKSLSLEDFKINIRGKDYRIKMQRIIEYYEKYNDYQEHFEKSDQLKFIKDIDILLGNYTFRLKKKYPLLNEKDIFFCCLCLLDLSDTQLGIVLERDRSNAFRRRKNILQKKMNENKASIENILKNI